MPKPQNHDLPSPTSCHVSPESARGQLCEVEKKSFGLQYAFSCGYARTHFAIALAVLVAHFVLPTRDRHTTGFLRGRSHPAVEYAVLSGPTSNLHGRMPNS